MDDLEHLSKLQRTALRTQQLLDAAQVEGAFIGGFAVGILTDYRSTRDVDAFVKGESVDLTVLLNKAKEMGLVPRVSDIGLDAKTILVLRFVDEESSIPVDLSIAWTPFELEAIENADRLKLPQGTVVVSRPEDLIIMKAIAHRPHDLADLRTLVDHYPDFDADRVEYWVRQYGEALEEPDLWERIQPILTNKE